jgi:hypothetical protein
MADDLFVQFSYLLEPDGKPPREREQMVPWNDICKAFANFHRWITEIGLLAESSTRAYVIFRRHR